MRCDNLQHVNNAPQRLVSTVDIFATSYTVASQKPHLMHHGM